MTVSWFHARTGRLPLGRSALGGLPSWRFWASRRRLRSPTSWPRHPTQRRPKRPRTPVRPAKSPEPPARPLLWLVDGPARIWIYGTLHTNDPRVLARPAAVDLAFRQSDGFFAETDLDCDMLADLMKVAALPEGETLSALLAPTLRKRLVEHLDVMGQSLATYEALEPWVLWFTLQAAVQGEACGEGMPLDWRLFQQAKRTGKTIGGLESPTEQFAPFDAMTREQQVHSWSARSISSSKPRTRAASPSHRWSASRVRGWRATRKRSAR
ncbi:MAG: TraB/GumN family protein [Planctomycetes bacterium]|nr:TraB/GumN family protein [Planctomycetota bacterium]